MCVSETPLILDWVKETGGGEGSSEVAYPFIHSPESFPLTYPGTPDAGPLLGHEWCSCFAGGGALSWGMVKWVNGISMISSPPSNVQGINFPRNGSIIWITAAASNQHTGGLKLHAEGASYYDLATYPFGGIQWLDAAVGDLAQFGIELYDTNPTGTAPANLVITFGVRWQHS